jgi:Holliday junction DNA helicase RuvA
MIASLRGTVVSVRLDSAVVEVGGIGVKVLATPSTLASLRVGEPTALAASLVVREDSLTLFGFATDDEREVFEIVQTVSGIGPRLALAMLAVHSPDALRRAIADEDLTALCRVPGIGRRGAQRIVLDLGHRLGPPPAAVDTAPVAAGSGHAEVGQALVGLGWSVRQAEAAVAAVAEAEPQADVAGLLRAALRHLGRST